MVSAYYHARRWAATVSSGRGVIRQFRESKEV